MHAAWPILGRRVGFIVIEISSLEVAYQAYWDDRNGGAYALQDQGILAGYVYLPYVVKSSP